MRKTLDHLFPVKTEHNKDTTKTEFNKKNMVKLTGLRKMKDSLGQTYLIGAMNALSTVLVLPNGFKEKEDDPDYILYIRESNPDRRDKSKFVREDIAIATTIDKQGEQHEKKD